MQLSEDPSGPNGRLSATAFDLRAENVGRDGVRVVVTFRADESQPEGGVYRGNVVVLRSAQPPITLALAVRVGDRENLYALALWSLVVGGACGLVIRWFNDTGIPVASSYRRLRRLGLLPANELSLLPRDVLDEFSDAADALQAADPAALSARMDRIETDLPALAAIA